MTKNEYNIYAGLGGGFGGERYHSTILAENLEEAEDYAYSRAREEYEMYEGNHGLKDWYDCAEELGFDPDNITEEQEKEVNVLYEESISDWVSFYAILTSEDTDVDEEDLVREHDLC